MFRYISCTVCCIAFVSMTSIAEAQIVRIGPFGGVRVRAPFVSVDVQPYGGGTRVRAPFTSVNTGPFRYPYAVPGYPIRPGYPALPALPPAPVYPVPAYPNGGYVYPQPDGYQAARPSTSGAVRDRLLASAQLLKRNLSARRDDGGVWLNYLQPDRIIETIQRGESADSLRTLLGNYDGVVANPGLTSISRASGFRETHQLLKAFIESPPASEPTPPPASDAVELAPIPAPAPVPEIGNEPAPAPADPFADRGSEELPLPAEPTPL
jgi:hypothetical protein